MECFASLTIGRGFTAGTAVSDCGRLSRSCSASRFYKDKRVCTDFQGSRDLYGKAVFKSKNWHKISGIHIARAEYHEGYVSSQFAPLELKSSAGQLLSDILQNQPHLFHVAAAKQLEELAADRDDAITRQELSSSDAYSVLHSMVLVDSELVLAFGKGMNEAGWCSIHNFV